jgi:hypothetical protein
MTYEEFLADNRNKLLGYFMLANSKPGTDPIDAPYPPALLTKDSLATLKELLRSFMPVDLMITDLWDWDIHFEEDLGDDWYFESIFGAEMSVLRCETELTKFFLKKCEEHHIDYDQFGNETSFEALVREHAARFIIGWRERTFAENTRSGEEVMHPQTAK